MRARQEDLRSALARAGRHRHRRECDRRAEHFARNHLVAPHHRLAGAAAAKIDNDIAVFDALDDAIDDFADAILIDVILLVALGLAGFL